MKVLRSPQTPSTVPVHVRPRVSPVNATTYAVRADEPTATVEQIAEKHGVAVADLIDFAGFFDVSTETELYLLPIVCESINCELPPGWQEVDDPNSDDTYFWNRNTGVTSWEHPLDAGFKKQIQEQRALGPASTALNETTNAKQSVRTTSTLDLYKAGKRLLDAKDFEKAIRAFTDAIGGGHPETALCYNLRGVCYSWLNQHQKALEDADKAVQLRPSATMYCNRGKAYRALQRLSDARVDQRKALQLKPDHNHAKSELKQLNSLLAKQRTGANVADDSKGLKARPATAACREKTKRTSVHIGNSSDSNEGANDNAAPDRPLSEWSVDEVLQWFKSKFSFAGKYVAAWEDQYISGVLLPFMTDEELKNDIGMTSSIHRNAVLRTIKALYTVTLSADSNNAMVIDEIKRQGNSATAMMNSPTTGRKAYGADPGDATPQSHQRRPPASPSNDSRSQVAAPYSRPLPVPADSRTCLETAETLNSPPRTRSGPRRLLVQEADDITGHAIDATQQQTAKEEQADITSASKLINVLDARKKATVTDNQETTAMSKPRCNNVAGQDVKLIADKIRKQIRDEGLRRIDVFHRFDRDKSGDLDAVELLAALAEFGLELSLVEAKAFIKTVDANRDGKVSIEEFLNFLRRPPSGHFRPQSAGRGARKPVSSQRCAEQSDPLVVSVSDEMVATAAIIQNQTSDDDSEIEQCFSRAEMAAKYDSTVSTNIRRRAQTRRTEIVDRLRNLRERASRIVPAG